MGFTAAPGRKERPRLEAGYELEPGEWEESNIIYEFEDGWSIREDKTDNDRTLLAKLTRTCVTSLVTFCYPEHPLLTKRRDEMVTKYGHDPKLKGYYTAKYEPFYRLMHLECPERKAHVCIVLGRASIVDNPNKRINFQYSASSDLGKQPPITLDGEGWYCIETRIGTGHRAPEYGMERICKWWAEVCDGKWDQESYDKTHVTYYEEIKDPEKQYPIEKGNYML